MNEEDLANTINAESSGSDYFHDEYKPRVIEFKGLKRVQNKDKVDVFLPPQKWQNWKVDEIIAELGGDTANDTAPPFSSPDFAETLEQVGFTRADMSSKKIQTYLDCVLERLDFQWNHDSKQFTPIPRVEDEPATSDTSNSGTSTID